MISRNSASLVVLICALAAPSFAADVTYERLLKPEPQNWLTNNHSFSAQRYSPLDMINKSNVKGLRLAFAVPIGGGSGNEHLQATPIVEDATQDELFLRTRALRDLFDRGRLQESESRAVHLQQFSVFRHQFYTCRRILDDGVQIALILLQGLLRPFALRHLSR